MASLPETREGKGEKGKADPGSAAPPPPEWKKGVNEKRGQARKKGMEKGVRLEKRGQLCLR
jgi:hypothetical protein